MLSAYCIITSACTEPDVCIRSCKTLRRGLRCVRCGSVLWAFLVLGFPRRAYDRFLFRNHMHPYMEQGLSHDILKPDGLCTWWRSIMCLVPDALAWFAPPCCGWVFMNRSRTKRTKVVTDALLAVGDESDVFQQVNCCLFYVEVHS